MNFELRLWGLPVRAILATRSGSGSDAALKCRMVLHGTGSGVGLYRVCGMRASSGSSGAVQLLR